MYHFKYVFKIKQTMDPKMSVDEVYERINVKSILSEKEVKDVIKIYFPTKARLYDTYRPMIAKKLIELENKKHFQKTRNDYFRGTYTEEEWIGIEEQRKYHIAKRAARFKTLPYGYNPGLSKKGDMQSVDEHFV